MNAIEIAAYLGAAAWVPQIITWVFRAAVKPLPKLVSAPTLELGYTTFGPILNLTCAIASSRKDALIERIAATFKHENGENHTLTWQWLEEILFTTTTTTGETGETKKSQPAIALKVPTAFLVEKKIGLQDLEFRREFNKYVEKLSDHLRYDSEEEKKKKVFSAKEFLDLNDFFKRACYWKEGKYLLHVNMHIVGKKEPHIQMFEFKLTKEQVDSIAKNTDNLRESIVPLILLGLKISDTEPGKDPVWNWVYPEVKNVT